MKRLPTILMLVALLPFSLPAGVGPQLSIEDLEAMRSTDPAALLQLLDQGLAEIEPDADPLYVAHQFRLRSETLCDRGEYVDAREDASEFQRRAQALKDPVLISRALMLLGTIDAEGVVPSVVLELHRQLSEVHEELGEPGPALHHLKALVSLREESLERERRSVVEELEVKYKVEQRDRQLELATLDSQLQEAQLRLLQLLLLATAVGLALACFGAMIAWRGYRVKSSLERELDLRNKDLEEAVEQISKLARTDTLTGLWNRRAFDELAEGEIARARRSGQPLTIVLADIDRFKALNDRFGHQGGDEVLKELSGQLRSALRRSDIVCRWGGEEFLCLLPNNDTSAARQAMERVREHMSEHPVNVGGEPLPVTMTFGIAALDDDIDAAIRDADAAMYEGKRKGRDRIVVAGSKPISQSSASGEAQTEEV